MLDKDTIRENLSSLPFVDKLKIWNDYCQHVHRIQDSILINKPTSVQLLLNNKFTVEDNVYTFMFMDRFNRDHPFITMLNEYVQTISKEYASALVDTNLRVDFTDAVYNQDAFALQYYNSYFYYKTEKDSEESNTVRSNCTNVPFNNNGKYIKCKYEIKDNKPTLVVEFGSDELEPTVMNFEGDKADSTFNLIKKSLGDENDFTIKFLDSIGNYKW